MNFGQALEALKQGKKARRAGWNGRGIFIALHCSENIETISENVHKAWMTEKEKQGETNHPDMVPYADLSESTKEYDRATARAVLEQTENMTQPYIYIDTTGLVTDNPAAPKGRVPWLASQTDMLAEDWEVV